MSCEETRPLVHAFADGELDLVAHARVEAHVRGCPECAAALARVRALSGAFRGADLSFPVPAKLALAAQATLRQADKARSPRAPRGALVRILRSVALVAAGLLVGLALRANVGAPSDDDPLAGEVVASHVRSLLAEHATDVASTDRHTVKPWFAGKLDYAPEVRDFASEGFPLVGGRLDYLAGRPVAALVYKRRLHVINHFEWPAAGAPDLPRTKAAARQGYTVFHWRRGGTEHFVVSELAEGELEDFVRLAEQP